MEFQGSKDKLVAHLVDGINIQAIQHLIEDEESTIIFPICGKRCYNSACKIRSIEKKAVAGQSEYATSLSWDNDGSETQKSSIEVLIGWITTEENASLYFGGLDIEGRTSATRKEAYHHEIRDLIKAENGE